MKNRVVWPGPKATREVNRGDGVCVEQEVQKAQAAQVQAKLLVSKCTNFRELKRLGKSGSSSLKSIGRHSKNQATVVLFLVLLILKILATFGNYCSISLCIEFASKYMFIIKCYGY